MKKKLELFLHVVAWVGIFLWLSGRVASHIHYANGIKNIAYFIDTNHHIWFWRIMTTICKASFFYANVYWLFSIFQPQSANGRKIIGPLIIHIAGIILVEFTLIFLLYNSLAKQVGEGAYLVFNYKLLDAQLIPYGLLLLLSYGYWASKQWLLHYKQLAQLQRTTAELQLIKNQINPHFLFNTLNNLFAMAIEKEAMALAESISQLTNMMRYTIYENQMAYVPLRKEITYIQNYIHLQQLRFTEAEVPIEFTIKGEPASIEIAPMLLINFVENAFKHGISLQRESFIFIHLEIQEKQLVFSVENTKHQRLERGYPQYSGLGLASSRKLLQLLYPSRHQLQINETTHVYKVLLSLGLRA